MSGRAMIKFVLTCATWCAVFAIHFIAKFW